MFFSTPEDEHNFYTEKFCLVRKRPYVCPGHDTRRHGTPVIRTSWLKVRARHSWTSPVLFLSCRRHCDWYSVPRHAGGIPHAGFWKKRVLNTVYSSEVARRSMFTLQFGTWRTETVHGNGRKQAAKSHAQPVPLTLHYAISPLAVHTECRLRSTTAYHV